LIATGWLVLAIGSLTVFSLYTLFTTSGPVFDLLQLVTLPHEFHLELLLLLIANVALSWSFEEYGAQIVARSIGDQMKKWRRMRGHRRSNDNKVYKAVQRSMED
jgi:cation-transporting P-type ATPase 13A2